LICLCMMRPSLDIPNVSPSVQCNRADLSCSSGVVSLALVGRALLGPVDFVLLVSFKALPKGPKAISLVCKIRGLHDAHRTQICRVTFAWHMRQILAGCAAHPRIRRKCCAPLPREERSTTDVTFGPLCTLYQVGGWVIVASLALQSGHRCRNVAPVGCHTCCPPCSWCYCC
jgi:hypothetical protein